MRRRIPYTFTFEDWMRALNAAPSWASLEADFVLFRDGQNDLRDRLNALEDKADIGRPKPRPAKS